MTTSPLRRFDWTLFATIVGLLILSCLFIYSADLRNADQMLDGMAGRQIVWALIGLGCYAAAASFDYRKLHSLHWGLYLAGLLALVLVLFFGVSVYGAHRWFAFGSVYIQPSEFAKLSTLFTLAVWLSDPSTDTDRLKTFFSAFALAAAPFVLIAIEPDLGSALVLVPMVLLLLFCAGSPLRPLLTLVGAGVVSLLTIILWLKYFPESFPLLTDYQKDRMLVFLNIAQDPLGTGWNAQQSLIAVGSGGLFGKGYLQGTQNILGFLPRTVAPTVFIFSVVAEETGFAGSSLLLALYTLVVVRCMRAAGQARDMLGTLLAAGVGGLIFSHVFVNIAMTIGLMPITGKPLPLMSYGGTFMVSTMTALGLVQSVYLRRRI
jgi:rod shape determining protein RodA